MIIKNINEIIISNSSEVALIIKCILIKEDKLDRDKEHFWVIGLNTEGRIKFIDLVHLGTLDSTPAFPRDIFRRAIMQSVKAIIIAHNHPSNDVSPSKLDYEVTKQLFEASLILEIPLLDHVIVSEKGNYYSFSSSTEIFKDNGSNLKMYKFGRRSLKNLETCHKDIQAVLNEAIKHFDFSVICGYRNRYKQDQAFKKGYSKVRYPNSNHNKKPSLAVDLVPYPIDWNDTLRFAFMAGIVITIADQMGIKLEWGGHWKSFKDYPHFQLKKKS